MLLSPHNPDVVFYGGNKLFRTADRGHKWEVISPDLTRNQEWKKLPGFFARGGERSDDKPSRDDGVSDFGTITTEGLRQRVLALIGKRLAAEDGA